jgi:hypothetical protein
MMREKNAGKGGNSVAELSRVYLSMRLPQHFLKLTLRPVSGLASFASSPSHADAQWSIDEAALTYRCGGSTGLGIKNSTPVSRLTARLLSRKHLKAVRTLT